LVPMTGGRVSYISEAYVKQAKKQKAHAPRYSIPKGKKRSAKSNGRSKVPEVAGNGTTLRSSDSRDVITRYADQRTPGLG